jgi:phage terminase small subunit
MSKLTPKQQKFVETYLANGRNAAAAYRLAYASKGSAATVAHRARDLLAHGQIKAIVASADAKAAKRLEKAADRYAVSKERISHELARLAFADARKLFVWGKGGVEVRDSAELDDDTAAPVIEVSQTVTSEGGTIRVKLADKRQALVDLARLHGHIVDRKDVRVIRSLQDLSDEELAALSASAAAEAKAAAR